MLLNDFTSTASQIVDWQESVKDRYDPTGGLPPTPSDGDRYISTATANGWTINNIYQWSDSSSSWVETVANEGMGCYVEDEDVIYIYNGVTWVPIGSVSGVTLDIAFDNGKIIDGANSSANAMLVGDGTQALSLWSENASNQTWLRTNSPSLILHSNSITAPTDYFELTTSTFFAAQIPTLKVNGGGIMFLTSDEPTGTGMWFTASGGSNLGVIGINETDSQFGISSNCTTTIQSNNEPYILNFNSDSGAPKSITISTYDTSIIDSPKLIIKPMGNLDLIPDTGTINVNGSTTDILGSELETITDGSNADILHDHTMASGITDEANYLLASGTRDLTGDWTIASNNILMTAGQMRFRSSANYIYSAAANRLNINSGLEEYHNTQLIRMYDTHASAGSRTWMQIYNKDGLLRFEVGSIANGNPQIRFNVVGDTRIGFPTSDPTYFAFINDYTEMWLGNQLDPRLYFNFYVGSAMDFGATMNRQSVRFYITDFKFDTITTGGGGTITHSNNCNMVFGTGIGTKLGTAINQKLGFWNATPIARPSSAGETVGFTAGSGTGVNDDSTFTGNVGSTAYNISDIVKHLKNIGLIAQ